MTGGRIMRRTRGDRLPADGAPVDGSRANGARATGARANRARAGGLGADRRGAAGVEFALAMPLMLALLFGTYEVCRLVAAHARLNNAAETVARLVAAQNTVTPAMMQDYCAAAKLLMQPFGTNTLSLAVASISATGSNTFAEDWEYDYACPTAANPIGSALAIGYTKGCCWWKAYSPPDSMILVTASYNYNAIVTYVLSGLYPMFHAAFVRPRINKTIPCSGC